jgi:hypothetical protein
MTTDAGSGFDDQAASRDAAANLDEVEEESRHLAGDELGDAVGDEAPDALGDEDPEETRERKRSHDRVNDAF